MCTAEVLIVSDVMRRPLPGRLQGGVCRRLFADEAPASTSRPSLYTALQAKLEEQHRRQCERWNFDFRTETPLPGRYQWERPGLQQRVPVNGSRMEVTASTTPRQQQPPLSTTQSKITDFLYIRKRPRSSSRKLKSARTDLSGATTHSISTPEQTSAS